MFFHLHLINKFTISIDEVTWIGDHKVMILQRCRLGTHHKIYTNQSQRQNIKHISDIQIKCQVCGFKNGARIDVYI
jgi:hypothetical protein